MTTRKWTRDETDAEVDYIKSVNVRFPGQPFNYKTECFQRYCQMQALQAIHSGFQAAAHEIRMQGRLRSDNSICPITF